MGSDYLAARIPAHWSVDEVTIVGVHSDSNTFVIQFPLYGDDGQIIMVDGIPDADSVDISPEALADWVAGQPGYRGGPVKLLACSTAAPNCDPAIRFAKRLGQEVLAPNMGVNGEGAFPIRDDPYRWKRDHAGWVHIGADGTVISSPTPHQVTYTDALATIPRQPGAEFRLLPEQPPLVEHGPDLHAPDATDGWLRGSAGLPEPLRSPLVLPGLDLHQPILPDLITTPLADPLVGRLQGDRLATPPMTGRSPGPRLLQATRALNSTVGLDPASAATALGGNPVADAAWPVLNTTGDAIAPVVDAVADATAPVVDVVDDALTPVLGTAGTALTLYLLWRAARATPCLVFGPPGYAACAVAPVP